MEINNRKSSTLHRGNSNANGHKRSRDEQSQQCCRAAATRQGVVCTGMVAMYNTTGAKRAAASASVKVGVAGSMAAPCTGKCRDIGIKGHNTSLYDVGMKYCSGCEKFFYSERSRCLCCGRQFRSRLSRKRREKEETSTDARL